MATEQFLRHSVVHNQTLGDGTDDWKSSSSGGFECNICLDTVQDPVVSVCGHLYCWPCIYKWIHQQSVSSEAHQPQCPVCKAEISERALIPLYGRGQSLTGQDEKAANLGLVIPDRPRRGVHALIATSTTTSQRPALQRESPAAFYGYTSAAGTGLAGNMFREMVYTRLFGNPQSFYTYPVSYGMASVRSARARRHTLHADQSLTRLSFFMFCCLLLCLVLF